MDGNKTILIIDATRLINKRLNSLIQILIELL
jgi:hypothetical protein